MTDPHAVWKDANGDETYALEWEIDEESRVWEIGGYEGRWASQIVAKYDPHVEIFEPQHGAYQKLIDRFRDFDKVGVYRFGLWVMECSLPLYHVGTDGASLVHAGSHSEACEFRDVCNLVPGRVDLCLMNIEGGEYALLPYMIGYDLMKYFRLFWCQFHPGLVELGWGRYRAICEGMERTHRRMWEFYPTAVAWERR